MTLKGPYFHGKPHFSAVYIGNFHKAFKKENKKGKYLIKYLYKSYYSGL